ncbi:hypothetical protein Y032_0468g2009 [Ancylostoma ceylanicum]|uniref:Uncharacterized protein n=1 Tax=Ancylostoma ceylanicum TaxID=53326 RepID=A0A016WX14_9BILA|nr:hypothetical protein Y032_0468g2009 [Ancylostoma ceylanicum]
MGKRKSAIGLAAYHVIIPAYLQRSENLQVRFRSCAASALFRNGDGGTEKEESRLVSVQMRRVNRYTDQLSCGLKRKKPNFGTTAGERLLSTPLNYADPYCEKHEFDATQ